MKYKRILIFISIGIMAVIGVCLGWLFGCNSRKKVSTTYNGGKGMYVDGTILRNADGSAFVMRGINHAHCWYQEQDEVAFEAIAATGANCIRIVCSDGDQWNADSKDSISTVLELAKKNNMVAILEIHDATGKDEVEKLERAAEFWIENADVLQGTEDYCIVNIANEWYGSWNADKWCAGYKNVIPGLREAGIENVIMVDAAGWGQYGRSIRKNGIEVFEADPNANTMFSIHMYGMSGRYEWLIRYNLEGVTKQNLCVCVGEFGYTHSDGNVKEEYLMKYCAEHDIGTLAWSFKGNSGGVEYLDLSRDWEGKNLTEQWGMVAIEGEYGIRNTSKQSSAFK